MALQTTVVGSMPKPEYFTMPSWVENGREKLDFVEACNRFYASIDKEEYERQLRRAIVETVNLQEEVGIDVITDGELNREKYIYRFCRNLEGFDFSHQSKKICRNGAWEGLLPKIVGQIKFGDNHVSIAKEWQVSSGLSNVPVKYTLPGPMTIADTMVDEYYNDEAALYQDLIYVINMEVKALANIGCKFIQIDEPVLVRYPDKALEFGIKNLAKCFEGLPSSVMKIVHCCCGYPQYLDQTDYLKADLDAYAQVAEELDKAGFDAVSVEDAHRRNDPKLFAKFKKTKIILGVIDVVRSHIETVEEIQDHVNSVLPYIPRERLIIAPDCGLLFLTREMVTAKLKNLVLAAKSV